MYISQLKIQNYRGIKLETLNFFKFNTLVGKNDCGKSTIINAIKFFFDDAKASQKDFNCYVNSKKDIEIEITLSEYDRNNLKSFLVGGEKEDGFGDVVEDYIQDGKLVIKKVWEYKENFEITAKTKIRVSNFIDHPIYTVKQMEVAKWIKLLLVSVPISGTGKNSDLEKLHALRLKLLEISEGRILSWQDIKWNDIKDCLPMVEFFKADQAIETTTTEFKSTFSTEVRSIIRTEKENGESGTLKGIEEKISQKIKKESDEIQKYMSEHISDLSKIIITPNFSWDKGVEITNVEIQLRGDEKLIPLENKGSGYRRLFMVGRLRYLADKKQSEDVIYLMEEPETFLHPSAQDEMRQSLLSLSESNQIFITTHSPIFAGSTRSGALTLCRKENAVLIYDQRDDADFLLNIAEELGVKPNHNILDTYKVIVFVEGVNDRDFLRIASEKLAKNFHTLEKNANIAVFDGGGQSLNNFVDIQFFEKQKKKMFLIIDSDNFDQEQELDSDSIKDEKIKKSLAEKYEQNIALKDKFNQKSNSKCFILKKKNIENYYHPKAIERKINLILNVNGLFADNFCVQTFLKKLKAENQQKNISIKNWMEIYHLMTNEEWREVSNNELEAFFDEINQELLVNI